MTSEEAHASHNTAHRQTPNFPFDEWSQSLQDTAQLVSIGEHSTEREFKPIRTPWSIVLLTLSMISLELSLFLVPHYCSDSRTCGNPPYSILMYIHGSLWFLFMLIDRYWRYEHYKSRTRGYLEFYRTTRHVRRIPILVYSGGTALLLIVSMVLVDHCKTDSHDTCPGIPLTRCQYTQILVTLEIVVILPCLLLYLVRTVRFNKAAKAPDIQEEEMIGSLTSSRSLCNGVGFRDDSFVDDILEKQADMIRYLKHHNNHLGRKILQLTAQLEHSVTS